MQRGERNRRTPSPNEIGDLNLIGYCKLGMTHYLFLFNILFIANDDYCMKNVIISVLRCYVACE